MVPDLRNSFEWRPASADNVVRELVSEWTGAQPTDSMRFAAPVEGHAWIWKLISLLAPGANPDESLCSDVDTFWPTSMEAYDTDHARWLDSVRPPNAEPIIVVANDTLLLMSWADFIERFANLGRESLAWTTDLGWAAIIYFDEFSASFRPRWKSIRGIARISKFRTPTGTIVSKDRLVIRFTDDTSAHPRLWESRRFGHGEDEASMMVVAQALAAASGVPIVEVALHPWDEWQRGGAG